MLRNTARPFLKGIPKINATRVSFNGVSAASRTSLSIQFHSLVAKRPTTVLPKSLNAVGITALRYATKPVDHIDTKAEKKSAGAELHAHPEAVSGGSSVRHVFESSQREVEDTDMLAGIRADLGTIKETFNLDEVPKEAYYIGLAGLLPYLATSLSTVGLAYDINHYTATGNSLLVPPETAHQLLAIIEPIQIGYGAVIISFLGAIHWGLEYAGFGGYHKYNRYAIGVIAPAIAWPTLLMPVESALITQFLAFNFLYFTDARATTRGWCPPWYSTYRFVLTFLAGASIVASLIGRGQIVSHDHTMRPESPYAKMMALQDMPWDTLEAEEREKRKKAAEEAEAEEGEEGDENDGEKKDDEDED